MKNYILIYEDKKGNELTRKNITAPDLKNARLQRNSALSISKINDLFTIKIITA